MRSISSSPAWLIAAMASRIALAEGAHAVASIAFLPALQSTRALSMASTLVPDIRPTYSELVTHSVLRVRGCSRSRPVGCLRRAASCADAPAMD